MIKLNTITVFRNMTPCDFVDQLSGPMHSLCLSEYSTLFSYGVVKVNNS